VDGSEDFDWEGTQFFVNVINATYVKIKLQPMGGIASRFLCQVNGWETTSFWVEGRMNTNTFIAASALDPRLIQTIRVINVLEPAFEHSNQNNYFRFLGFVTDGAFTAAGPFKKRKIELVGDSISAGYGSRGFSGAPLGCPVNGYTSGNPYTYNWFLAEYFNADLVPIAWSGKGMYENCCDNGETMPSYYLQSLGGESSDWNFKRYVPDMILINLGTNDFGHDTGPAWEAKFASTYVDFVFNATRRYGNTRMPIFVAQGPMNCNSNLRNTLNTVIQKINNNGGNATYLNVCGPPNDGCGGHPGVQGHLQMFQQAKPVISQVMGW